VKMDKIKVKVLDKELDIEIREEDIILSNLLRNLEYAKKFLMYLKSDYFLEKNDREIFKIIDDYIKKYESIPDDNTLILLLKKTKDYEENFEHLKRIISLDISSNHPDWLAQVTREYIKNKDLYLSLCESLDIYEDKQRIEERYKMEELIRKSLSLSFDTTVGSRYSDKNNRLVETTVRIPFNQSILNIVTKGGCKRKTLNVILGGIHVGKSLTMVSLAADYARLGYNVVYFTLEMSESDVLLRLDANLLNKAISELEVMDYEERFRLIDDVCKNNIGKIIVKEFPTSSATVLDFNNVLIELNKIENVVPDVIMVDYINIVKATSILGKADSYSYMKIVSQELRALAQRTNTVLWSGVQINREGLKKGEDAEMEDTAESMGIPAISDLYVFIYRPQELASINGVIVKQLKNRYANFRNNRTFKMLINDEKQLLSNFYENEQEIEYQPEVEKEQVQKDDNSLYDEIEFD
jgi:replicative DNA helicase